LLLLFKALLLKKVTLIFFLVSISAGFGSTAFGQHGKPSLKVVIIRHGEKPVEGDNLSCQGLNRALELSEVLHKKIGVPAYTYVPAPSLGKSTARARMYQTIVPFAAKYNLTINTDYDVKDAKGIAQTVLDKSGTVLLVWEHNMIPEIVRKLGVKDTNLAWSDNDFDSMWIVSFTNGKVALTKESEHINPSKECK
jgi:hypothetical protein